MTAWLRDPFLPAFCRHRPWACWLLCCQEVPSYSCPSCVTFVPLPESWLAGPALCPGVSSFVGMCPGLGLFHASPRGALGGIAPSMHSGQFVLEIPWTVHEYLPFVVSGLSFCEWDVIASCTAQGSSEKRTDKICLCLCIYIYLHQAILRLLSIYPSILLVPYPSTHPHATMEAECHDLPSASQKPTKA